MLVAEKSDGVMCWNHALNSTECPKKMTAIDHASVTTDLCDVKLHRILLDAGEQLRTERIQFHLRITGSGTNQIRILFSERPFRVYKRME